MKEKIQKSEALLVKFFNWAKSEVPTYRIRDLNTDLLVQHFLQYLDIMTNSEETLPNQYDRIGTFCEKCRNVVCCCDESEAWDIILNKNSKEASDDCFGLADWLKDNYLPPSNKL